jgi:uncharacterized Tic20 family protein
MAVSRPIPVHPARVEARVVLCCRIVGVIAWVVLASLAAAKASQGQAYRYPLTMRLVR